MKRYFALGDDSPGLREYLSLFSLKFYDKERERQFTIKNTNRLIPFYRFSLIMSVFIYLILALSDFFLFTESWSVFFRIRLCVVSPALLVVFGVTFWKKYPLYSQVINFIVIIIACLGIFLMRGIGQHYPDISRVYIGLILIYFCMYSFMNFRVVLISITGFLITGLYILFEWTLAFPDPHNIVFEAIILLAFNVLGFISAYHFEFQMRKDFIFQEKLEEISTNDELTQLKNRYFFEKFVIKSVSDFVKERSAVKINKRDMDIRNHYYGLFFIDIDYFKKVNDLYGHSAGDLVLKQFAQILRSCVRETDVVVRWGGEEFLIILRNLKREYNASFVRKIGRIIEQSDFDIGPSGPVHLSCSIGFLEIPFSLEAVDMDNLINYADQALYRSKSDGRNRATEVSSRGDEIVFIEHLWNE